MENQKFGKLAFKEKFGYSLGDAAANLAWRPLMAFLPIFYTDTFGLPLASVGLLLALTRSFDGITDVIMGSICDRTKTRWGKFRPYLLWTAVPFGVLLALTFTTPDLGPTGKLIWAYATYALLTLAYTANNVPYSSLSGVMTGSIRERTNLSSYRFFGAYLGGFISIGLLPYLVDFIGPKLAPEGSFETVQDAFGYQYSFYLLAVMLIVFSLIAFKSTKERITPPKKQKSNFKAEFKELIKNRPWVIILIVGFLWVTYNSIRQGAAAYYFKWIVGDAEMVGIFFIGVILASMASTFIAPALTDFFGKKRLFILVMIITGLFTSSMYFVRDDVVMFFVLGILAELAAGIMPILFFAMLGDTADYSEYVHKRRATGLTFSAGTFAMKFGGGMAGIAMMFVLTQFDYKPNPKVDDPIHIDGPHRKIMSIDKDTTYNKNEILSRTTLDIEKVKGKVVSQPADTTVAKYKMIVKTTIFEEITGIKKIFTHEHKQPERTLIGIMIINSFLPVIFIILAIIIILFYPLTSDKMQAIEAELKSRKEKEETEK